MMGAVAAAARSGGAHTIGVIPQSMVEREWADHASDELLVVESMRERKAQMEARADAFLALPGGLGYVRGAVRDLDLGLPAAARQAGGAARPRRALDRPARVGARPRGAGLRRCGGAAAARRHHRRARRPGRLRRPGSHVIKFGTRTPAQDRALVMAIVNRTPDSFYDRGATFAERRRDGAGRRGGGRRRGHHRHRRGQGGPRRRRRPRRGDPPRGAVRRRGARPPPRRRDQRRHVARPRSAAAAVAAGADLLNDTWAGADPALGEVAAELGVGIVCSHTGGAAPRRRPHRVALRRRGGRRDRRGHRARRSALRRARGAPGRASSSTRPTTSARTPSTPWSSCRHCDQLVGHRLARAGGVVEQGLHRRDARRHGGHRPAGGHPRRDRRSRPRRAPACSGPTRWRPPRRTVDMVASIVGTRPPARTVRALA